METLFDPETGKLVIGAEAVEAETAGTLMGDYDFEQPPSDSVKPGQQPLSELLTTDNFPYEKGAFRDGYLKGWTAEELTAAGAWIMKLVQTEGESTIRTEHINRLNSLGVIPSIDAFNETAGPLWKMRQELNGKVIGVPASEYQQWSRDQWAEYAAQVEQFAGGRKPTREDYKAAADALGGPSIGNITRTTPGIDYLNELNGYPSKTGWDRESIIEWGASVMEANPQYEVGTRMVKILSKRRVGPSDWEIRKHFGGGNPEFQQLAAEEYERRQQAQAAQQCELASRYDDTMAKAPPGIERPMYDEAEKAAFVAKYELASRYLTAEYKIFEMCARGGDAFLRNVLKRNPNITAGQVELQAELNGTMDIIWPPKRNPKMTVTDQDLGYKNTPPKRTRRGGEAATSIRDVQADLAVANDKVQEARDRVLQALTGLEEFEATLQSCLSDSWQPDAAEALGLAAQAREQTAQLQQTVSDGIDSIKRIGERL